MTNEKVLSLLGLAARAGKVKSGGFSTENEIKALHAYLVVLAADASDNTKKKFTDMCSWYKVPLEVLSCSKEELGHRIGKEMRTSAAVTDEGFAIALLKLIRNRQHDTNE